MEQLIDLLSSVEKNIQDMHEVVLIKDNNVGVY